MGKGNVPSGAQEAGSTPGKRGQAQRGEQRLSSAGAEGAGEGVPRPSWGVLLHVLRLCPSLWGFPSQGQSLAPQNRNDAEEGRGSTPYTLSPVATSRTSPESPSPSYDSHWTVPPPRGTNSSTAYFQTLPLYWASWDVSAPPQPTSQEAGLTLTSSQARPDPRQGLPQDTFIQSPLPNLGIATSLLESIPNQFLMLSASIPCRAPEMAPLARLPSASLHIVCRAPPPRFAYLLRSAPCPSLPPRLSPCPPPCLGSLHPALPHGLPHPVPPRVAAAAAAGKVQPSVARGYK